MHFHLNTLTIIIDIPHDGVNSFHPLQAENRNSSDFGLTYALESTQKYWTSRIFGYLHTLIYMVMKTQSPDVFCHYCTFKAHGVQQAARHQKISFIFAGLLRLGIDLPGCDGK